MDTNSIDNPPLRAQHQQPQDAQKRKNEENYVPTGSMSRFLPLSIEDGDYREHYDQYDGESDEGEEDDDDEGRPFLIPRHRHPPSVSSSSLPLPCPSRMLSGNHNDQDSLMREDPIAYHLQQQRKTLSNFTRMSILFSANHGCVVACLALATAQWGSIGAWQSGFLYISYTITALLVATWIVKHLGSKRALVAGMTMYVAYVGCFWILATSLLVWNHHHHQQDFDHEEEGLEGSVNEDSPETMVRRIVVIAAYGGAVVGGAGAGFLWTAQGSYFSHAADAHCRHGRLAAAAKAGRHIKSVDGNYEQDLSRSTSLLAGVFAFWYLAEEVALRLLSTVLLEFQIATWQGIFGLYTLITIATALATLQIYDYDNEESHSKNLDSNTPTRKRHPSDETPNATESSISHSKKSSHSIFYKATAAVQLLARDPKMKYTIGFNAAYGFASAFSNSYINGEVISLALNDPNSKWLGLITSWGSAVAASMSLVFGRLAPTVGNLPILMLGALCFLGVAVPFVVVPDAQAWGWTGLVSVYTMLGIGRATFEGTLKATFANYFHYEKEGAFANITIHNGLSSSIGYILTFSLHCSNTSNRYCVQFRDGSSQFVLAFELIVIAASILGIFGHWKAAKLHRQETLGGHSTLPSKLPIPENDLEKFLGDS